MSETISHYRILRKLGEGGMAEVYLAEDLHLGRKVALKFLPPDITRDHDLAGRFEREARAASALNHPNILTIHEIGTENNRRYIAEEYVEGKTLRTKIGQISMEEAMEIAIQVLTGLHVAHQAGIIHRDIKPENVMIREDGIVKLLDFGLAKLTKVSDLAQENFTTMLQTTKGFITGTVPYMSPEQARGLEVDHRSDLFSVGTVIYEMVSGRRPFQEATPADTLFAIIGKDPAISDVNLPEALHQILTKALSKDPDARYQTASDFLRDLKSIQKGNTKLLSTVAIKPVAKRWGFSFFQRKKQKSGSGAVPLFAKLTQITFAEAVEQYPDWSPDGKRIVFCRDISGLRKLFLKNIRTGEEIQLTTGDHDEIQPAWSPDGSRILLVRSRETGIQLEPRDVFGIYDGADIWSIDLETHKESKILKNAYNPSFSADGKHLAFDASWAGARRIWIATAEGLNAQQVTTDVSEEISHSRPRWSPDAKHIVFQNQERTKFSVGVVDLVSRRLASLTDGFFSDLNPVWSGSGEYIYFSSYRSGGLNIWRIPVSQQAEATDAPQQVTVGAGQDVELSISRNGKYLAFSILKQNADIWRLPLDAKTGEPAGAPQPVIATTREDSRGAWSSDGESVAFNSDRTGDMNIWIHSLKDGSVRQMTNGPGGDYQPNWSPDAKSITFFSNRSGHPSVWLLNCTNGNLKQLTKNNRMNINPFFSPDGGWIAYHSDETGRPEVWVMRADGSDKCQITSIGVRGHFLRWSADGNSIFFFCPYSERPGVFQAGIRADEPRLIAETTAGAHISFSPDYSMLMDVAGHKSLWVTPLRSGVSKKIFEFEDPAARIDYPVWSPDGHSVLFDLFRPQGGDIWMLTL